MGNRGFGWIVGTALVASGIVVWALGSGPTEEGIRIGLRLTARLAGSLFLVTFTCSSLHALVRRPFTAALLRQRRSLGLSVFAAMVAHGTLIATLALTFPGFRVSPLTVVGGGLGYLLLISMAASSSDAAVRWLGARRWKGLHRTGMVALWLIFVTSWLGEPGVPTVLVVLLVGAALLRIAVALRATLRSRQAARGASW